MNESCFILNAPCQPVLLLKQACLVKMGKSLILAGQGPILQHLEDPKHACMLPHD